MSTILIHILTHDGSRGTPNNCVGNLRQFLLSYTGIRRTLTFASVTPE